MKKLWQLIRYYYLWQPVIPLCVGIGLFLFVLKVVFTNTSATVTFFLGLTSFALMFVIPFFSGATALRHLIANPHTSMVPGFRRMAMLAHLVIAIVASIYLYINFLIFAPDDYSPLVMVRTFICFSAYAGFMQLILPSRYFITIISLAPLLFVTLLLHFKDLAATLFLDTNFTITLFLVTLAGWAYGFRTLETVATFHPANMALNNTQAWASYDGGFLTRMAIGRSRTAQGTLLLGYPDNWWAIVLRVIYLFIFTPLLSTGAMYFIGVTEEWEAPKLDALVTLFLIMSLFSGVFCIYMYGELAARARLVWLRFGTDRHTQWQLVEYYCLRFLGVYFVCALGIVLVARMLSGIEDIYLLHFLLIIVSYCSFNLYFSLLARASRLPSLVTVFVIIACMLALLAGILSTVADTPSFTPLLVIEGIFLVLALSFRLQVKQLFTGIDWYQVRLSKTPGKIALSRD